MSEKTLLIPSAPLNDDGTIKILNEEYADQQHIRSNNTYKMIIMPGVDFDPSRRYRYGTHAAFAAILILVSFVLIEMRDCNWSPGINLDRLQTIHICLMVFTLVFFILSLCSLADLLFRQKILFFASVLVLYSFVLVMVWMTYEAATNPCVKTLASVPIDISLPDGKNVFSKGDWLGIVVLLLDIAATLLMVSSASNFYRRY